MKKKKKKRKKKGGKACHEYSAAEMKLSFDEAWLAGDIAPGREDLVKTSAVRYEACGWEPTPSVRNGAWLGV